MHGYSTPLHSLQLSVVLCNFWCEQTEASLSSLSQLASDPVCMHAPANVANAILADSELLQSSLLLNHCFGFAKMRQ